MGDLKRVRLDLRFGLSLKKRVTCTPFVLVSSFLLYASLVFACNHSIKHGSRTRKKHKHITMDLDLDEDSVMLHPIQTEKQFTATPDYSDYGSFASTGTALVIDNGTHSLNQLSN